MPSTSFAAKQVAGILENILPGSIGFGIIADNPRAPLNAPVPGWEVFINATDGPIVLETAEDVGVSILEGSGGWRGGAHPQRVLRSMVVRLEPKQVHLKRRRDFLVAVSRSGTKGGPNRPDPGLWTLIPRYHQWDKSDDRWTGALTGRPVAIQFE